MSDQDLQKILAELYQLDPELKQHAAALKNLLVSMSDFQPDTKFDPAFAAELKQRILSQSSKPAFKIKTNFSFMNKKIYLATGALAIFAFALLSVLKISQKVPSMPFSGLATKEVSELPNGAFGRLGSGSATDMQATATPAPGLGGGSASGALAERSMGGGGFAPVSNLAVDAKMIAPYYAYRYEYKGEALNLESASGAVFRRLKNDGQSGKALASLLSGFDLPLIDLDSFANLRATNLSLTEDKDLGLMINFDFNEDTVFISENWEKWRITERENCGNDQACYDRWRLKISDVPADSQLIALADNFLASKNINRANYGEPLVDNSWRLMYDQSPDKANAYIPEYATVIYPLLIDNQAVRDQSGSYTGLRVTINLLKNSASGVSGLSPYRYESSAYDLETAADAVISAAEKGGWNRLWYGESTNIQTLELGTPEKAYIQWWRYINGRNDELIVPALVFPVLNAPNENYFGPRQVIVPLVKELLAEINQSEPLFPQPIDGGSGDQPVIMVEPAATPLRPEPRLESLPAETTSNPAL